MHDRIAIHDCNIVICLTLHFFIFYPTVVVRLDLLRRRESMNSKLKTNATSILAAGMLLTASGCSSLKGYTLNGVPIEKLYADSGQITTDATMDGESDGFCEDNPVGCVIAGALAVGGVTWAIVDYNRNRTTTGTTTPPAAPPAAPPAF